jgi:hypothetical protein
LQHQLIEIRQQIGQIIQEGHADLNGHGLPLQMNQLDNETGFALGDPGSQSHLIQTFYLI